MFGNHKDKAPEQTVADARRILERIGSFPIERLWSQLTRHTHWVRLQEASPAGSGTWGKGVTPTFALASAYAEYLERIQGGWLFRRTFGAMSDVVFRYPDVERATVAALLHDRDEPWLRDLLAGTAPDDEIELAPFHEVQTGRIQLLPHGLLAAACTTTGLASGNTAEEALTQGICEVMERMVRFQIFCGGRSFPTIPKDELRELPVFEMLEAIESMGIQCVVKDLTMGGRLPVLGVLFLNRNRDRCRLCVGSDVDLQVALQRNLTEIALSQDPTTFEDSMVPMNFGDNHEDPMRYRDAKQVSLYEYLDCCENNRGWPPLTFYHSQPFDPRYRSAFLSDVVSNREALRFLVARVAEANKPLFVRDYSFLGFPTLWVYVPGWSESVRWPGGDLPTEYQAAEAMAREQRAARQLARLPSLADEELASLADDLEAMARDPVFRHPSLVPYSLMAHLNAPGGDAPPMAQLLGNLPYGIVLLTILYHLGEYERAYEVGRFILAGDEMAQVLEHTMALPLVEGHDGSTSMGGLAQAGLYILRRKAGGCPDEDVMAATADLFGSELAQLARGMLSLASLPFPDCGDCRACVWSDYCVYPTWRAVTERLLDEMQTHMPSQAALATFFSAVLAR